MMNIKTKKTLFIINLLFFKDKKFCIYALLMDHKKNYDCYILYTERWQKKRFKKTSIVRLEEQINDLGAVIYIKKRYINDFSQLVDLICNVVFSSGLVPLKKHVHIYDI